MHDLARYMQYVYVFSTVVMHVHGSEALDV
jgi:hypothetical protein